MTTALPDASTLTPDEWQTLIYSWDPEVGLGCELLNFDLTLDRDISEYVTFDGDVHWSGDSAPNRDIDITIKLQLPWGVALVRVYRTIRDKITGQGARVTRGVFCLQTPDEPMGEQATSPDGFPCRQYEVTGQDVTALLDRQASYSVYIPTTASDGSTTTIGDALNSLLEQSGVPMPLFIDSRAKDQPIGQPLVWPRIPPSDDTSSTDSATTAADPQIASNSDESGGATWRQMFNDVLSQISYRAIWADQNGALQATPYFDASTGAPIATLNAVDPVVGHVSLDDSTISVDPYNAPNFYTFQWSNMPDDSEGNPVTASYDNGGLIDMTNQSDGPASIDQRNGLVYAVTVPLTATSADTFQAQAQRRFDTDKQVVETFDITVHPALLIFGHFDVVQFTYGRPDGDGGTTVQTVKCQVTDWQEHHDNTATSVTLESV